MKTRRWASFVIGIDEVGRGALAGPVTVAAVCLPESLIIRNPRLGILRDSKKLSPLQREKWFAYFRNQPALCYSIARVYPRGIEQLNITKAANRAASIAFERLIKSFQSSQQHTNKLEFVGMFKIFLDGGLYLGNKRGLTRKFQRLSASSQRWSAITVIRGDEKIAAVAIASIIAKVSRDGYMKRLSKKYPRYGFEVHKGYGTKKHFRAIRQHGASPAHRLTFLDFLKSSKQKRENFSRKS